MGISVISEFEKPIMKAFVYIKSPLHYCSKRKKLQAHQQFQQNPYQYAKPLLDEKAQRSPSFTKVTAEKYFKEVNSVKKRDYKYHPLLGMKRPPKPTIQFNTKLPTLSELIACLHKRRNASALGTNRIPYLVGMEKVSQKNLLHELITNI